MLTPQEVAEHTFTKSPFGGYNMSMVDEFLEELTEDYTALYKENAALKAKMKVLVDKVEEYRATEDAMRRALLTAQNMASAMVSEAEEKKAALLASAEQEANEKLGALHDEIVVEQKRLNQIKAQTKEFADSARTLCERQLRALELLSKVLGLGEQADGDDAADCGVVILPEVMAGEETEEESLPLEGKVARSAG